MKWYTASLKRVLKGIVLFLFPIWLLVFIMERVIALVRDLILPIKQYLPTERILGVGLLSLISLALVLLVCYMAGVLAEKKRVKSFIAKLENNVLVFIPGYTLLKSRASDAIGEADDNWKAVLTGDEEEWTLSIEIDQQDGYSTVFFPEPPDAQSGEIRLVPQSKVKRLDISVGKMMGIIRKYGRGASVLAK
ncbi:MAG TPA: hypothetical protein VIZ28_11670 [Chitinophagaceae bacterium]